MIEGTKDLTVTVGGSVSYREGVTVSDNADETVQLMIRILSGKRPILRAARLTVWVIKP